MLSLWYLGLAALAAAQSTTTSSALTVATDGSGQFTAINAAVSAAQVSGIPTVTVLPGTYSETITIQGTQTVTIAGPTASSYTANQVVIAAAPSATGVVRFNTQNSLGVVFKNVNITNTYATAGSKAPAVSMVGSNMAFYGCALTSTGTGVYTASFGTTLIANSYIQGTDKLFYNYVTLYVYNSVIVPTASSASIYYAQGYETTSGVWYNSSLVVDSSAIQAAAGATNTYVYLAAPNGNYTRAVFRGTSMGSLMAPAALRATVCNYIAFYGEYDNSGAGALSASNQASRLAVCDNALTTAQVDALTIDQIFGQGFSGYSSYSTSWIDPVVLAAIQSSDASQTAAVGVSSTTSSTTTSTSSTTSSTATSATSSSITTTATSGASTTTITSSITSSTVTSAASSSVTTTATSGASTTTTSTPSSGAASSSPSSTTTSTASSTITSSTTTSPSITAVTVGPSSASAQFTDIGAAISYAQNSAIPSVSVLAGTYSAFTVTGTATITVVGPTASSVANNQVLVTSSGTSGSLVIGSSSAEGATFRYLNFTNTATSGAGPAVAMRGVDMGFYGCALISSTYGVYSASYGFSLIANSYVSGTDKLFYNYPTVYVFNSTIVPTASSASIIYAKGAQIGTTYYNSTLIVDTSTVAAAAGSSVSNVYLGTANGATGYITAIYRGSSLGSLISAGGVYTTSCTAVTNFGEFQNTGAGSYASNSASRGSVTCDYLLSADQVSQYNISAVFGNSFSPYGSTSTSWIDATVLASIDSADAAQIASASASSSTTTSSTSTGASTGTATTSTSTSSTTCSALKPSGTVTVSKNATSCQYSTVSSAIAALPADGNPYTISIEAGTYVEQISITRSGKVTLVGQTVYPNDFSQNTVTIEFANGQLTSAGLDETTPVVSVKNGASGWAAYNIDFINTNPQTANTAALAADFYGTNIALYGCSFIGFQDTLLANKGTQVFSNCYIEGSIDFVWGFSTAYFHQCYIAINTAGACISAQSRTAGTVSGYVFDTCLVTYTSTYGSTYGLSFLGRPYSNYSTAIYMNSYLDKQIAEAGWHVWTTSSPQTSNVTFGEYNNSGPGSWQADTVRASFATNLTATQASAYSLTNWIGDTSWLDTTAYNYDVSFSWPNASSTSTSTTPSSTATSSTNAHPDSGTVPPAGAVLVSPNGEVSGSFANLTAALAALPDDSTNQTIFIYSGNYTEQPPGIDRSGPVRIIGYTTASPGQSYADNTVTITFNAYHLLSSTTGSDSDSATFTTESNTIALYNINIINTANLDGATSNDITLAANVDGSQIGFYGCSFVGWQDTLLTSSTIGYQYFESCYIEGAIDFIWGYSKAYFKGCTIAAKHASSCMTAQSRASSTAIGGYIFDQCLLTEAADATTTLTNEVYMGRPYSQYALVVVKYSYIDSVINPSGWKIWSTTDPRTNYSTFAEYNNTGPSNWENNVAAREAFQYCTLLTSDTYTLDEVMASTSWIDLTYWDSIVTPTPAGSTSSSGNTTTAAYNGTVPPTGALIVSQSPIENMTVYATIQDALDAAPTSSKTNATIFIYPGTYEEQLIISKDGTTIFMGYSEYPDDYSANQVIIVQDTGIDTQTTNSTYGDVNGATVYVTGDYFYAYNINFRNENGTQDDIASLGFAIATGSYASMYGCQVYGNQDTLYAKGTFFTYNTYIEGNIDFIFGNGYAYFLNSTISPNEDGDNITADKRASNTTGGGMVFDQCQIVPAADVDSTGWNNVSLGRPWSEYAQVVYIDCYLDSMIGAAGWDQWSKSSPQTDYVIYGEYHNYGPGSSTCGRAPFSEQLSDTQVAAYELDTFLPAVNFIDWSFVNVSAFTVGIGSAPAACSTSSSSSTSATSTALVTQTTTLKAITTTSLTGVTVTATSTSYITDDEEITVTPSENFKTSVVKATITSVSTSIVDSSVTIKTTSTQINTVTATANAVTVKSTETEVFTATATGKASTILVTSVNVLTSTVSAKATTLKSTETSTTTVTSIGKVVTSLITSTVLSTIDYTPAVSTIKGTTTITISSTTTPKAVTITDNEGSLVTAYKTSTPKAVTSTTTISVTGSSVVKTSTAKASTTTVLVTSVATSTKKSTLTCNPTGNAKMRKRGLGPRAAGVLTSTVFTTLTSFTKTVIVTQPGSTYTTLVVGTTTLEETTTLPKTTSTVLSTSYATVYQVVTQIGEMDTFTSVVVKTAVSTYTLPASTITTVTDLDQTVTTTLAGALVTSTKLSTSYVTVSAPGSTIVSTIDDIVTDVVTLSGSTLTSVNVVTAKTTLTEAQSTVTSLNTVTSAVKVTAATPTSTLVEDVDSTTTLTTTLPISTAVVTKTATIAGPTSTITITPAAVTKTSTVKSTSTVISIVTKSASTAAACTA